MKFEFATRHFPFRQLFTIGIVWIVIAACSSQKAEPVTSTPISQELTNAVQEQPPPQSQLYFVQVAAFSNEANALKLRETLTRLGHPTENMKTRSADGAGLWKVLVGPHETESDAARALVALRRRGYAEAFVRSETMEVESPDIEREIESLAVSSDTLEQQPTGKQLTDTGGCGHPQWSPNGREIAFFKRTATEEGLYTIGTGGGPHSRIVKSVPDFQVTAKFAWAPDGETVAFVAEVVNSRFERVQNLFAIDKGSLNHTTLLEQKRNDYSITHLKWSPDGTHIALEADYADRDAGAFNLTSVFVVQYPGTHRQEKLQEASKSDALHRLAGWDGNDSILFLKLKEDRAERGDAAYETWKYNVTTRDRERLKPELRMPYCLEADYLAASRSLFCSAARGRHAAPAAMLLVFGLERGSRQVLAEAHSGRDYLSRIESSADGHFFFFYNNELWVNSPSEHIKVIPIATSARHFTLSPSGKRLCVENGGNLFSFRLDF